MRLVALNRRDIHGRVTCLRFATDSKVAKSARSEVSYEGERIPINLQSSHGAGATRQF